jgi:hypothetical protein
MKIGWKTFEQMTHGTKIDNFVLLHQQPSCTYSYSREA